MTTTIVRTEIHVSVAKRRARRAAFVGIVLGALCVGAPTVSFAQQPAPPTGVKSARELYKSGDTKFKAGDYAGALVDFQAVDSLKPTPQAARFIGLCQDKLGHLQDAVVSYERFLSNVPPKLVAEGEEIKARVAAIKAMPGKVHLDTAPSGAQVNVDGKPNAKPTPVDLELTPGKHTLMVTSPGHQSQQRDVDVAYASNTDVNLQLAEEAPVAPPPPVAAVTPPVAPPPPPPPPPEPRSKLPAYITGGLGVASAAVGVIFGVLALNDKSSFNKTPTSSLADSGENNALICDMAFGVAVTLGVTSAVLFLTSDDAPAKTHGLTDRPVVVAAPKKSPTFTLSASPIVTPHGGGAGAVLRF